MVAMSRMPKGSNGLQPVDVGQGRGVMGWWAGPHVVVVASPISFFYFCFLFFVKNT